MGDFFVPIINMEIAGKTIKVRGIRAAKATLRAGARIGEGAMSSPVARAFRVSFGRTVAGKKISTRETKMF
jgi:hypothetical protein